jgi:hypothetical protein
MWRLMGGKWGDCWEKWGFDLMAHGFYGWHTDFTDGTRILRIGHGFYFFIFNTGFNKF